MNSVHALILTAGLLVVAGCATGYHPTNYTGGFSETQLAPDVFRVTFRANGYSDSERAQDFAMLRAAELTREHGFTHFVLLNSQDSTRYLASGDELIAKPRTGILVRLTRGPAGGAFNAAFLMRSIRTKYQLDR